MVDSVADQLRALGVRGILVTAAEKGVISILECAMPECLCPRGRAYFEPAGPPATDWEPTMDHYPKLKTHGGHRTLNNSRLSHRLCNRFDYSRAVGRSHKRDLARVEAERQRMEAEGEDAPT